MIVVGAAILIVLALLGIWKLLNRDSGNPKF